MSRPLPDLNAPFTNPLTGKVEQPWNIWLQQFSQRASPAVSVPLSVSPVAYTAGEPGTLMIDGGTITSVFMARGSTVINVGTPRLIPLGRGDAVTINYSVIPTSITFWPTI